MSASVTTHARAHTHMHFHRVLELQIHIEGHMLIHDFSLAGETQPTSSGLMLEQPMSLNPLEFSPPLRKHPYVALLTRRCLYWNLIDAFNPVLIITICSVCHNQ